MNTVYIVLGSLDYEGIDILNIYSNKQKAEEYKKNIEQNGYKYDVFVKEKINHTITYDKIFIEEHQVL